MTVHDHFRWSRIKLIAALPICFILFLGGGLLYESYHSPIFFAVAIVGFGGFARGLTLSPRAREGEGGAQNLSRSFSTARQFLAAKLRKSAKHCANEFARGHL